MAIHHGALTFQKRLLAWYRSSKRDLPWRLTHDPYAITVSEMMLQQTQVDRVIPKFHAWMQRFPTVSVLASAKTTDVIAAWQGLGYNRRALYLQRLARAVIERHEGFFPRTLEELRALPGIGPYTAGAIMSFAFQKSEPIVDTNVQRVVGRVFVGYKKLLHLSDERIWNITRNIIPRGRSAYAFNQGLMDFGSLVCTARKPACDRCPMQSICASYPKILSASAEELRLKKPAREKQYFGQPRRIWRGKILRYLHTLPEGTAVSPRTIGEAIQNDFVVARLPWLETVLSVLEADGLIQRKRRRVLLP